MQIMTTEVCVAKVTAGKRKNAVYARDNDSDPISKAGLPMGDRAIIPHAIPEQ